MDPGWTKVIAATAVALLGLLGLNLAIWRRLRQVSRERGELPPGGE
ncbi:hypothetical protein [Sphingomonas sp. Leaf412]|nr:hypothetical protein [Sphingomonas sp. Leaf412]